MRLCFVIMPIRAGDEYRIHLNRYKYIIEPAVRSVQRNGQPVYDVLRGDLVSKTGSITRNILQQIYSADVVIADLTDLNPNVFYELGVRHALRNGTILMALEGTLTPFDVGDLRIIHYQDRVGGELEAIPQIKSFLEEIVDSKTQDDSPVFLALPKLGEPAIRDATEAKARVSALENEVSDLHVKLAVAENTNLYLRESSAAFEKTINSVLDRLGSQAREVAGVAVENVVRQRDVKPKRPAPVIPGVDVDPFSVFVLMPFRKEFEIIFEMIREAASKHGFTVLRADELFAPGRITDQILKAIQRAGLIVADITDSNPNVLYEVGIAHTLHKETVLISQKGQSIPFDIAAIRIIFYEKSMKGSEGLRRQLEAVFSETREDRMNDG